MISQEALQNKTENYAFLYKMQNGLSIKKKKKDVGFVLKSTLKPSTSLHLEAINKKQRRS